MATPTPAGSAGKKKTSKKASKKPRSGQRQTAKSAQAKRDAEAKEDAARPKPRGLAPVPPMANASVTNVTNTATKPEPEATEDEAAEDRLAEIYRLEELVESARDKYTDAKFKAKTAKASFDEAEQRLAGEIHDQRVGPGPLFPSSGA